MFTPNYREKIKFERHIGIGVDEVVVHNMGL